MKRVRTLCILLCLLMLTGCVKKTTLTLPENPVEFQTGVFVNPENAEDEYQSLEYQGRTYILYGTIGSKLKDTDLGDCLGYLVQDGEKLDQMWVFELKADPEVNYLVIIDMEGFMSQPTFSRAIDTKGKEIETPAFVESLGYEYWN